MGFLKREKLQENRRGLDGAEKNLGWKEYLLYYIAYTVLFAVTAATIFIWFYLKKRRFVWQTDGISQHYYGLLYVNITKNSTKNCIFQNIKWSKTA